MKKTRLSDIFNADSIRNKKRILDRFEINKREKRLFLDVIEEIENNGGGITGGDEWKYYDISSLSDDKKAICGEIGMIVKKSNGDVIPIGTLAFTNDFTSVICFGVDSNVMVTVNGQLSPISIMLDLFAPMLASMGIKEITKEEFYNTNI